MAMLAKFNHNPLSTHFMSNCAGSSRARKGVEYYVAINGRKLKNALKKTFRLGCGEQIIYVH